jgi:D-alanyl-D-alanine dipeptidase
MLSAEKKSKVKNLMTLVILVSPIVFYACKQKKESVNSKSLTAKIQQADSLLSAKDTNAFQQTAFKYDYDTSRWQEIGVENGILLDLRYAGERNFVKEQLYDCPRCFLRPDVAEALLKATDYFSKKGYRLKLFDCYRPRQVQERLWEKVPNASYVTPPAKGSMHNRGAAVDLTLTDQGNEELDMGTDFDFFGPRAHHTYQELPQSILANRTLLKEGMAKFGFKSIRTEWWHYSFRGQSFPLDTMQWLCEH